MAGFADVGAPGKVVRNHGNMVMPDRSTSFSA